MQSGTSKAKMDIVVCTVNLLERTKTAFETLYRNESEPFHLIVVDICSTDGTQEGLKSFAEEKGNVTLCLKTEKDKGFGEGFNTGLEKCITPFVGSYHSDMTLTESGWIKKVLPLFSDPKVAYVGSKLLYPTGLIQHAGASFNLLTLLWYHLGYREVDGSRWSRIIEVPGVTGAGSVTRISSIPQGLPTKYERAEYSDVELSCRLRSENWKILYDGEIVFTHEESLSKKGWDREAAARRYRNHFTTFKRGWEQFLIEDMKKNIDLYLEGVIYNNTASQIPNTITAITGAKDRIANLPLIVKRLQAQTIKPEKIIIWHDYGIDKTDLKIEGTTCINCTKGDWQSFPQFVMAWLQKSKYIAVIDDDRPPGPKWFEYVTEWEERQPGIYGCFLPGTEVVTPHGLKKIEDVKVGEDIYTLNPESHQVEIQKVEKTWEYPFKGSLFYLNHEKVEFGITSDHWMFGKPFNEMEERFLRTEEAAKLYRITLEKLKPLPNLNTIRENVNKIKLIAWYITEGSIEQVPGISNRITITQVNPRYRKEIMKIFKSNKLKLSINGANLRFSSKEWCKFFTEECGRGSYKKHVPVYFYSLSDRQTRLFLAEIMKGDGRANKRDYRTVSKELANDIVFLAQKCGYSTSLVGPDKSNCYTIHISPKRGTNAVLKRIHYKLIPYEGKIFCLTVKNHVILAGLGKKFQWIGQCFGYKIKDPQAVYHNLELLEPDIHPWDDSIHEVDMVGQSYFFPTEYIKYFFMEKPFTWTCVDDLHLAHMCSKYGRIKSYVLFPSNPLKRPCLDKSESPLNEWTYAEHQHPDHRRNREEYVRRAYANGWKLKFLEGK